MTHENPNAHDIRLARVHHPFLRADSDRRRLGALNLGLLKLWSLSVCACQVESSSAGGNGQSQPPSQTNAPSSSAPSSHTSSGSPTTSDPTTTLATHSTSVTPAPAPTGISSNSGASGATGGASADEITDSTARSDGPSSSSNENTDTSAAPNSDRSTEVCRRWNEDRAELSEGTWSGDIQACDAGDVSAPGRENALKLVNLYRYLADMPAVEMDPERNQRAQECALMQSANGLSHEPPMSWKCYTEVGANASGVSSISSGQGVLSIDLYMTDGGVNANTMGHRRWVFANSLGPVGFGSATSSCFYQADGDGDARKPFVAWPPPGPVPLQAILTTEVDTAGWTIQSDSFNLEGATVSVEEGGQPLAVTQTTLPGGYGSRYALRIVPTAWTLEAGHSYHVAALDTDIDYTIDVIDCGN